MSSVAPCLGGAGVASTFIQSPTKEGDQLSIGNCLVHSPVLTSCHVEHPCVEAPQALPNCGPNRLLLIEVVILVVLRTLQGQLKCETILGDLVDPYSRGDLGCS